VKSWAYEIYKGEKAVHDSILWISSDGNLRGTGEDTIDMLNNVGLSAKRINHVEEKRNESSGFYNIRVWSKEALSQELFNGIDRVIVANKEVLAGKLTTNLGDENIIPDGVYSIREVTPAYSRKNNTKLQNSMMLTLIN
jgi:hypothetical protein